MRQPLILDGGLATGLESLGAKLHPQLWSASVFIENRPLVTRLHRLFVEAGAEILIGASYQMSYRALVEFGHSVAEVDALLRATIDCARDAATQAGSSVLVAASIGPYGAARADGSEYRGDYGVDRRTLRRFHERRLRTLESARPDWLAIETLPCRHELDALCELLDESGSPSWISFSAPDGRHLADGLPLEEAAARADACGAVKYVGVNCLEPERVLDAIERLERGTGKALLVYPNSGERWDAIRRCWQGEAARRRFLDLASEWTNHPLWAVGGCCRVGPDWIRDLRRKLRPGEFRQSM